MAFRRSRSRRSFRRSTSRYGRRRSSPARRRSTMRSRFTPIGYRM